MKENYVVYKYTSDNWCPNYGISTESSNVENYDLVKISFNEYNFLGFSRGHQYGYSVTVTGDDDHYYTKDYEDDESGARALFLLLCIEKDITRTLCDELGMGTL